MRLCKYIGQSTILRLGRCITRQKQFNTVCSCAQLQYFYGPACIVLDADRVHVTHAVLAFRLTRPLSSARSPQGVGLLQITDLYGDLCFWFPLILINLPPVAAREPGITSLTKMPKCSSRSLFRPPVMRNPRPVLHPSIVISFGDLALCSSVET